MKQWRDGTSKMDIPVEELNDRRHALMMVFCNAINQAPMDGVDGGSW